MKARLMGAALVGVLTAGAGQAAVASPGDAAPAIEAVLHGDEGGVGSRSVKLASAVTSPFLFTSEARQSPLTPVAEGGEGGEGRRGRRLGNQRRDIERLRAQEVRRLRQERDFGGYRYQARPRTYDPYYDRPRARDPYYDQRSFGPRF